MRKKLDIAAITILLIVASLFVGMQSIELTKANWVIMPQSPNTDTPIITVTSPTNNMAIYSGEVALNVTIEKPTSWNQTKYDPNVIADISYVHYVLDGITSSLFDAEYYNPTPNDDLPLISNFSKILTGLSDGVHTLKVIIYSQSQYAPERGPFGDAMPPFYWQNTTTTSETIHFNVQKANPQESTTPVPTLLAPSQSPTPTNTSAFATKVSIISPLNNSFFNVSIEGVSYQLIYETDTALSWVGYSIGGNGYSIEGKGSGNVTVSENGTWVRDFGSSGYHTLTLYANDTSGNWASPQTVTYLVNFYPDYPPTSTPSPTQQPIMEPSFTPLVGPEPAYWILYTIAGVTAVAVVVLGLLVYFPKRGRVMP